MRKPTDDLSKPSRNQLTTSAGNPIADNQNSLTAGPRGDGNDDYTQPGNLFRLFNAEQKQRLFDNIAAAMQGVPNDIKRRQIELFAQCDPAYGAGVAKAVKLEPPADDRLKGTSATDEPAETLTAT